MDDKDWLILKTVAAEKNITKAAERLYISQPALTYRLHNLEKEFAVKIFLRTTSGITLTPQGECLLQYAQEMLRQLRKLRERLQSMADDVRGELSLGVSSIFAHYRLPAILKGFLACYPYVEPHVKTGLSYQVDKMLHQEEVTVGIMRGDYFWPEEKFLLSEEPICLASKDKISLADLPRLPRISYDTDSSLKSMIDDWWRENYASPPLITMEVDRMDTCRQMVFYGLGWAILPQVGLEAAPDLYVEPLYWRNGSPFVRRTWLMCRTASLELSAVRAFITYTKNYFAHREPPLSA